MYVINRKSSVGDLENLMDDEPDTVALATEVTIAWLANPNTKVAVEEVARFLSAIHSALASLSAASPALDEPVETQFKPAVGVRKSLSIVGRIISMIDGKPYTSLTRHLNARSITPTEYRQRYGLKADYPMVAPAFSQMRSEMSRRLGLGRKSAKSPRKAK